MFAGCDFYLMLFLLSLRATCKVIIKQRMCNFGMRWTDASTRNVLTLHCFYESDGKWNQFWDKLNKSGFNIK
jgi:hypothetical protein